MKLSIGVFFILRVADDTCPQGMDNFAHAIIHGHFRL